MKNSKTQTTQITSNHTHLAIIGIGCLFPKADNLEAYWANISGRIDAIGDVPETHWEPEYYSGKNAKSPEKLCTSRGGFIPSIDFNPLEFGIPPNAIEAIDTSQLLGLVITQQALKDAGYGVGGRQFDRNRVSVIMGVTGTLELVIPLGARLGHPIWRKSLKEAGVEDSVIEDIVQRIASSYVPWQENSFPGLLGNVVAGRIANNFDLGGTNCVIDAACASSLSALHLASLELISGRSDMVITGGIDTFNDVFMFTCFNETQALSPGGNARPFDAKADGTILGEGLGILILKRLDDAVKDNDKVYAVIRGIGTSSDGKGQAIYAPSPEGQVRALKQAYEISNVTTDSIELIEAHGTGTKAGDIAELTALTEVYSGSKNHGPWCALGSVKSQIGHTKAAAGVAGIIKAAMALHHKVLPPTIKVDQPTEKIASGLTPFYINTENRPWLPQADHPRRAAVSSFGFGGSNFHCVLEEFEPTKTGIDWNGQVQILSFSADNLERIKTHLNQWPQNIGWEELRQEAEACRSRFNNQHTYRLVLVVEKNRTNVNKTIDNAKTMLANHPEKTFWATPDGTYFGRGNPSGKLGLVFPGQGSQYVGMFRDLACCFPQMYQAIEKANRSFTDENTSESVFRLIDYIYPLPVFTEQDRKKNETALRETRIAQPAIGAVSLGALKVLDYFGIESHVVAGHSYGELTALCASERMGTDAYFSLSKLRGQLMSEGSGDKGGMLAVRASEERTEQLIRDEGLDLVIANKNAPNQMVLSGSTEEIERASLAFNKREIRNRRLPVSGAFHSSLVAHVREPFLAALKNVRFSDGKFPAFANKTASEYPQDPDETRNILSSQLVNPVEFVKEIQNMYASGVRTFLEVGPAAKLTGLIKDILKDHDHAALSVDASSGKNSGQFDLASALAFLSARGYNVKLTVWDDCIKNKPLKKEKKKPHMIIPICGANHINLKPRKPSLKSPKNKIQADSPKNPDPQCPVNRTEGFSSAQNMKRQPVSTDMNSTMSHSSLTEALRMTQENMAKLQKFQEQTTQIHRQFLEGQTAAQRTFESLVDQQRMLIQASLGITDRTLSGPLHQNNPLVNGPLVQSQPASPADSVKEPSDRHSEAPNTFKATSPVTAEEVQMPDHERDPSPQGPDAQTDMAPAMDIDFGRIEKILLEVVAEKTGYPVEMLELNMELDSDLGIDSIKRVEILSDIQEKLPEAPVVKPEHLGSLKTLEQIVAFLAGHSETSGEPHTISEMNASCSMPSSEASGVEKNPDEIDSSDLPSSGSEPLVFSGNGLERKVLLRVKLDEKMVRHSFSIHAGAKIWITDENTGLATDLFQQLELLNFAPEIISVQDFGQKEKPSILGGLIILSPSSGAGDDFIKNSFRLMKHVSPALRNAGKQGGSVLITVSRMDGHFGLTSLNGQNDPASGGIAGLLKTALHEWPEVHCKALDIAGNYKSSKDAAAAIVDEMFLEGPVEVGLSNDGRYILELKSLPLHQSSDTEVPPVKEGEVVVITGGARGVTAEVAAAISRKFKPTLVLLGRSPKPAPEPDWLVPLRDESEIKKNLLDRANTDVSPKQIEEQFREIIARRELLKNIDRIESIGSKVIYLSVDVRDTEKVQSVLEEIRSQVGPIKGLIHGAGVILDRLIEDKTDEQFDMVYSTKVSGLRALLKAMEQDDLKFMVLFSSTTGRYGRTGQVDYAVANEVLNKFAQQQTRLRPTCRVVSINWGPWEGGMVNPSLKKIFEQEGISLINLEAGATYLVDEISLSQEVPSAEIVVMGKSNGKYHHGDVVSAHSGLSVAFERNLSIHDYPFLKSHVMNGRAVLPLAMIIEWMAHGAMHGSPGMKFIGFNDLRVLKGLTLEEDEVTSIRVLTGKAAKNGIKRIIPVELAGSNGNGNTHVHARADIVLAANHPEKISPLPGIPLSSYPFDSHEIYNTGRLFHGPDFHGIKKIEGYSDQGIAAIVKAAPLPSAWIKSPLRSAWLVDPLILDSSFQMMILWSFENKGVGSLPSFAKHYQQFQSSYPTKEVRVISRITHSSEHKALADMDFIDPDTGTLIARMEGYECIIDASLNCAFRCNQLPGQNGMKALA